ncbi:MAG: ribosome maturation factor RimP [Clostridiales bacterium]|nr:ribosome maturation factor RimP [Clostridiales bacterium]
MAQNKVEKLVEGIVKPITNAENFELVDVEFKKEGPSRYLRVFIDKEGGISLDDCQLVSKQVSARLDELDSIEESYFLEVSSPGLDRPLKKESDFTKYIGKNIELKLYKPIEGNKMIEGELIGLIEGKISIKLEDGDVFEIEKEKVALTRLLLNFREG